MSMAILPDSITMTRPDDWHMHICNGPALAYSMARFGRVLIMPNLKLPITDTHEAWICYEKVHVTARELGHMHFEPLMALCLTDNTTPKDVNEAAKHKSIKAFKLHPINSATNPTDGVTDITKIKNVLEAIEEQDLVLCIHGELLRHNADEVDIFDREKRFIEEILLGLVERYPKLRIVLEHITTATAVQFVENARPGVAATITAHHLLENRNALFRNGFDPRYWCLPILKREEDRQALIRAATSGNPKFFLGTDSASHAKHAEVNTCGCVSCFTAHVAIELYAEVFESVSALGRLEGFASYFGADFYNLPHNHDTITLVRQKQRIPDLYQFGDILMVPYRANQTVAWTLENEHNY